MKLYAIITIILLVLIPSTLAVALTPAKNVLNFEANKEQSIRLMLFNTENKTLDLGVSVEGDLKQFITLESSGMVLLSNETSKPFRFTLKFPKTLEQQTYTTKIFFKDQLTNQAITHTLIVNVEGPGTILVGDSSNKSISLALNILNPKESKLYIYLIVSVIIIILIALLAHNYEMKHRRLAEAQNAIRQALKEGRSLDQIKDAAVKAKWDEYILKKAFK